MQSQQQLRFFHVVLAACRKENATSRVVNLVGLANLKGGALTDWQTVSQPLHVQHSLAACPILERSKCRPRDLSRMIYPQLKQGPTTQSTFVAAALFTSLTQDLPEPLTKS